VGAGMKPNTTQARARDADEMIGEAAVEGGSPTSVIVRTPEPSDAPSAPNCQYVAGSASAALRHQAKQLIVVGVDWNRMEGL
jgi:hypothetical protein